jgi:hypothetical protein
MILEELFEQTDDAINMSNEEEDVSQSGKELSTPKKYHIFSR